MKNNCCNEGKVAPKQGVCGGTFRFGFTLIEILVVVLIIGILGAIMLPQYQRAVLKSRYASLMPIAKSMADSNEAYFLEHGIYADNAQDLPVQGRQNYPDGTELEFGTSSDYAYVLATNQNGTPNNSYVVYQKHSKNFPANIHCEALDADEQATELCRDALHGTPINTGEIKSLSGEGYTAYLLSGSTSGSTFDRSCEGDPETITQPCLGGCGIMSATPTCNPYTGEWEAQDFDPSVCPDQPDPETEKCDSSDGTKTRTASCNADGTAYEWGQWDESACCTGEPPTPFSYATNECTGQNTGSSPVCVNGQWQWASFSGNINCTGYTGSNTQCTTSAEGAFNGGACTGTYTASAKCYAEGEYGCSNSTFLGKRYKDKAGYTGQTAACYGKAEYGCANSTFGVADTGFPDSSSLCSGTAAYGCAGSTFTGPGNGVYGARVLCSGSAENACANSTFENRAYCYGSKTEACKGSTFKSNSYCYANAAGACNDVHYDGGCCYSTSGYCPAGSPKCVMSGRTYTSGTAWQTVTIDGTW